MQDLLIDKYFDIQANGDFTVGISDIQNQELLLICSKGSFKQKPALCVGLWSYLESEDPAILISEIKAQFKGDGIEVKNVQIKNGIITREAYYP